MISSGFNNYFLPVDSINYTSKHHYMMCDLFAGACLTVRYMPYI